MYIYVVRVANEIGQVGRFVLVTNVKFEEIVQFRSIHLTLNRCELLIVNVEEVYETISIIHGQ